MQNNQNSTQTIEIDGQTFPSFQADGVFSLEYVKHLLKNHSLVEQNSDDEDERSIQLERGLDVELSVDCEAGDIQIRSNINDLIDNQGKSIALSYGIDELIIDLSCDCLTAHH